MPNDVSQDIDIIINDSITELTLRNAYNTWEIVKDWTEPTFIVGDLNTYEDYQFPIDFMCGKVTYQDTTGDFKDMWTERHRHEEGFTFSVPSVLSS